VQRRWVTFQGCVRSSAQGVALESAVRQVGDVEAVIGGWDMIRVVHKISQRLKRTPVVDVRVESCLRIGPALRT